MTFKLKTPDELLKIFDSKKLVIKFFEDLEKYLVFQMESNELTSSTHALAPRYGHSAWNPAAMHDLNFIKVFQDIERDEWYDHKMKTPGQFQKLLDELGLPHSMLEDFIERKIIGQKIIKREETKNAFV